VLEEYFQRAFATGEAGPLDVIGYGEISSVVRWDGETGPAACKRLPNFPTREDREAHIALMSEYIAMLATRGVHALPTEYGELDTGNGAFVVYAVQHAVAPECLAVPSLLRSSPEEGRNLLERVIEATAAVFESPLLGVDAQLSNWVVVDGELHYLDITTPFFRDPSTGLSRLDTRLFVASLPWLLRWPVQRFMAGSIVAEYFDLRITLLNFLANLEKERADDWIPAAVEISNGYLDDPITADEVHRYYAKDARMWAALQRLRRADRLWRLKVRRRPYPVLLPGRIER
jgi:hypothetical protein